MLSFILQPPNGFPELRRLDLSKVSKESCFKSLKVHGHLRDRFRKSPVTYGYNLIGGEPAKACLTKVPPGEVVLSVAVFYPINVSVGCTVMDIYCTEVDVVCTSVLVLCSSQLLLTLIHSR